MKTLVLALMLARPSLAAPSTAPVAGSSAPVQAPALPAGSLESARIRLNAQDAAGALADAQAAVDKTHGADAYAARADAMLALGRSMDEVIADYEQASKLDPRYLERYKGLIVQRDSERNAGSKAGASGKEIDSGFNGLALTLGLTMISVLVLIVAFVLIRGHEKPVSPPRSESDAPKIEPPEGP